MANCYLRVPKYVAIYFRNRDACKKLPIGSVLSFDNSTKLWNVFVNMIHSNNADLVVPIGSFCERQWRRMLRGNTLCLTSSSAPSEKKVHHPPKNNWLSDEDVSTLAGISKKPRNDDGEYLCLKLPTEVYANNVICKVNGQWQLMNSGAKKMILLMTEEFWRAAFLYIRNYRKWCMEKNIKTSDIEVLQKFLNYIEANSDDPNKGINKMLSNYYYWKKRYQFNEDDIVEHASDTGMNIY